MAATGTGLTCQSAENPPTGLQEHGAALSDRMINLAARLYLFVATQSSQVPQLPTRPLDTSLRCAPAVLPALPGAATPGDRDAEVGGRAGVQRPLKTRTCACAAARNVRPWASDVISRCWESATVGAGLVRRQSC